MRVTIQNISQYILSTDVGLLNPGDTKVMDVGPEDAYRMAEQLKVLVDAGHVTVSVAAEDAQLDALEPAAVGTASVADLAVTTAKLAAKAVTTAKIDDLAVEAGQIGALAVETAKIDDLAVTEGKIGALAVVAAKIGAKAVTTAKIDDLAVTAGQLGALAVETAKLNDLAVTEGKIGALAVTNGKLGLLSVDSGQIAANAVIAGKIATGGVSAAAQLASGVVSPVKLANIATNYAVPIVIRKTFVAAGPGAADDVEIFAAAAVPQKMIILDAFCVFTTAIDTKSVQLRDAAAGAGNAILGAMTSGVPASLQRQVGAAGSFTINTTDGLFARRSDNGLAGEVVIWALPTA